MSANRYFSASIKVLNTSNHTLISAHFILLFSKGEYSLAVTESDATVFIKSLQCESLLLSESLLLLVVVQKGKKWVVFSFDFIINFIPVFAFCNLSAFGNLLLEAISAWHVDLEEVEKDVGVEEWSDALDLFGCRHSGLLN